MHEPEMETVQDWVARHDNTQIGTRALNRFLYADPPLLVVADVARLNRRELMRLKNMGKKTVAAIEKWLVDDKITKSNPVSATVPYVADPATRIAAALERIADAIEFGYNRSQ